MIENDLLDELIANGLSTCFYLATYKRKSWEILKIYDSQPKIARTTTGDLILFCHECEFPADDLYDLGQHMYEDHMDDNEKKVDCHYCDETFTYKDSAMKHRKETHKEKV